MGHVIWRSIRREWESAQTRALRHRWAVVTYRVWPYPYARTKSWWLWKQYAKRSQSELIEAQGEAGERG